MRSPLRIQYPQTGSREWRANNRLVGPLHRVDGPAVEDDNGQKAWWVKGNLLAHDGGETPMVAMRPLPGEKP